MIAGLLAACKPVAEPGSWVVIDSAESARPVVVTARPGLPPADLRAEFRWVTSVKWYYPVTDKGMPSVQQLKTMLELEDEIESHVVARQLSMLALTRTGNGLREWVYYAKERRVGEDEIAGLARASGENIQVMVREEPEWTSLRNVLSRESAKK
jgi:hypothetical protein